MFKFHQSHNSPAEKKFKELFFAYLNKKYNTNETITKIFNQKKLNFNEKWNEWIGNELIGISILFRNNGDPAIIATAKNYIDFLVSTPSFSVVKMEKDEVNTLHITLGLVYAFDTFKEHIDYKERILNKILHIYEQSLSNTKTDWYIQKCNLHNHTFHMILLRYICLIFLKKYAKNTIDTEDDLLKIREAFSKNIELMITNYNGLTYESASYMSYSFASICTFLHLEQSQFSIKYNQYSQLSNFIDYIFFCLDQKSGYAYNYSDSPVFISYGPEHSVNFLINYFNLSSDRNNSILENLYSLKAERFNDDYINRNIESFSYLHFTHCIEEKFAFSDVTSPKIWRINSIGTVKFSDQNRTLWHRYGAYGGIDSWLLDSINIGHDYPSIGSISYIQDSNHIFSNPFYLTPKKSLVSGGAHIKTKHSELYPNGSFEYQQCVKNKTSNWLTPDSTKWSPSNSRYIKKFLTTVTHINNYCNQNIKHFRILILPEKKGLAILDIFYFCDKQDSAIKIGYPNALNKFTKENGIVSCGETQINYSKNSEVHITNDTMKFHGKPYNLSLLTLETRVNNNNINSSYISIDAPIESLSISGFYLVLNINSDTLHIDINDFI